MKRRIALMERMITDFERMAAKLPSCGAWT